MNSSTLRRFTAVAAGSGLIAGAMIAFTPISPANAAGTSAAFGYTGATQNFNIPTGVQVLSVIADGGAGSAGAKGSGGGLAGVTSAALNVSTASSIAVNVGGAGSGATGGFNGGGNGGTGSETGGAGGGASDIRISDTRMLVAPGGGGGGTQVAASPSSVATSSTYTAVTCPLTGLSVATPYYFDVFAVQNGTPVSGQSPQSFETEAKAVHTFNAPFPKKIKYKGLTTLLKKKSKTTAGMPIKVSLAKSNRGAYDNRATCVSSRRSPRKTARSWCRPTGRSST